jgi:outer membrane lipoprotein SlyB
MNNRIGVWALAIAISLGGLTLASPAVAQHHGNGNDRDRYEDVCDYCGTVRGISRISERRNSRNNGAILVGALIGGALGNQVGKGDGRRAATVAGAVAGGVIANNSSRDDRRRTMYRISVRMDSGRIYNFDQRSAYGLRTGTRVEVSGNEVRALRR